MTHIVVNGGGVSSLSVAAELSKTTRTPVNRLLESWAGLLSFAPDHTSVLCTVPDQPAFLWCAGQGGYRMQNSPAATRWIAGLVFDRPPDLPTSAVDALRPERLR